MTAPTPEESAGHQPLPDNMLPKEAAEYFRVKPFTILTWLRDPEVFPHAFKIANSWRIPREDVIAYAKRLQGDRSGSLTPRAESRNPRRKRR